MSNVSASGRRPRELDDRTWLQRRYLRDGDRAIAKDLGVSRGTVIRARARLGIASEPDGRRRGAATTIRTFRKASDLIAERIAQQSRNNGLGVGAPSRQMLATRTRALHEAFTEGSKQDIEQALIELAAGCGLVFDHMQRSA